MQQRFVRAEEAAQRVEKNKAQRRKHDAKAERHCYKQRKVLTGLLEPAHAYLLGNERIAARAEHHAKCQRQTDHRHDDVYRRQSVRVDEAGDKNAVDGGVYVFKNA